MLLIRIPLIVLFFLLTAAFGTLACLLRPFHPDNTRIFSNIYSKYGLKLLGIKLTMENFERTPKTPAIYVANHQDNLDLFVCGAAVAERTVTVGKSSLKYLPLFGQLYWLSGNVFIDRKNSNKSAATLESSTNALKNENTSIWVFAEGTRNKGHNLLPLKSGAFRMAIDAQAPIIPICISSYKKNINLGKLQAGNVRINQLPAIPTVGKSQNDINELKEKCWAQMDQEIKRLDSIAYGKES